MEQQLEQRFDAIEEAIFGAMREVREELVAVNARADEHAKANREQHVDIKGDINTAIAGAHVRMDGIDKRVGKLDRETAVNTSRAGLWGFIGGGSLLAIIAALKEAIQHFKG